MTMPERAADMVVRNLIEALNRLHDDLDRVELWIVVLSSFEQPPPEYRPDSEYLLPLRKAAHPYA
ncbi:MAG: hypothetical protein ACLPX7_25130 [Xanthobacteraceae bacterium]